MSSTIDPRLNPALTPIVPEPEREKKAQEAVVQGVGIPDDNDDDVAPQHGHAGGNKSGKAGAHGGKGAHTNPSGIDKKKISALALAGLSPADADSVTRGTPSANKFGSDSSILQSPAPMPPNTPTLNKQSSQLFGSLNQDMQGVLGSTDSPASSEVKASIGQIPGAISALSQAPANSPQAKAAQQTLSKSANSLTQRIGTMLSSLAGGDAMAAFLLLAVENKSSGKEVQSAMQDLVSQGRNTAIKQQANEQAEAAKKAQAAAKKAEILKKLGPIIDLIVTAVALAVTALSEGTLAPVMFAMVAAVMGFMIGGAVGGAKNHNGFDLAGAATGAGIGAAITGPIKLLLQNLIKLAEKIAIKAGLKAAVTAATKTSLNAAEKAGVKGGIAAAEKTSEQTAERGEKLAEHAEQQAKRHKKEIERAEDRPQATSQSDDDLTPQKEKVGGSSKGKAASLAGKARGHIQQSARGYRDTFSTLGSDVVANAKALPQQAKDFVKNPISTLRKSWEEERAFSDKSMAMIKEKAAARAEREGISEEQATKFEINAHATRLNKVSSIAQGAMQISNQVTQAIQNYEVAMKQADAKQHQAYAKGWKVLADQMQDMWQNIQDNLSNLTQNHAQVVNQATQMLNSHNQANVNAVSNIAR